MDGCLKKKKSMILFFFNEINAVETISAQHLWIKYQKVRHTWQTLFWYYKIEATGFESNNTTKCKR